LKGCDSRSVVNLVKEGQVKRDALFIVGVACAGILDAEKLLAAVGDGAVTNVEEDDDTIVVTSRSGTKRLKRTDYLSLSCKACEHPVPSVYDKLVGEAPSGFQSPIVNRQSSIARDFLAKPRAERWREFEAELGKCIRCYACRQACPNCYCRECFAEQTRPKWLGVTSELSDVMFYHIGRIFHQAGRCVDCGACARACPTGVNLRLFTSLLADEVKARFGTEPGLSLEEPSPLLTHRMDDRQEFMVEPERG
jgi:ferredoxin